MMGHLARFLKDGIRKHAGQMVFADDHFDVDAEVSLGAEDFEDAALRGTRGGGPVGDFHIYDQAFKIFMVRSGAGFRSEDAMGGGGFRSGRNFEAEGNGDGLGHALVEGDDEVGAFIIAPGVMKNADDGSVASREDAKNASGAAIVAAAKARRS